MAERMMRTDLTVRQLEILKMFAKGPTNKEIAQALGISDSTVRNHVNSIIENSTCPIGPRRRRRQSSAASLPSMTEFQTTESSLRACSGYWA
jgi:FixJ family two-component response regulator